ncbi:MAG: molybdopterin dinucleotide-binding protein [Candidatus Brockarchaeota archaeon]|nr:molybdopterin dinucleotide-binding protein [Candidatus Brockarchaeota archaeon]
MKVKLVTVRSLAQGGAKDRKFADEFNKAATRCEVDEEDMEELGVKPGECVKLTTREGSVVLEATKSSQSPHRGIVFVAYGPWINSITSSETGGTGMPTLKGAEAEIEPCPGGRVLGLEELLDRNLKKAGRLE